MGKTLIDHPRHDLAAIEQGCVFVLVASILCSALLSSRFLVSSTLIVSMIYAVVSILWICFCVGIGVYVGYWTKRPGWLMGSLPILIWYGIISVVIWLLVGPPPSLAFGIVAMMIGFSAVVSAVGGFIGQRMHSRNSTS